MLPDRDIASLLKIMAALRDPKSGCPWDIAQDFASIARYTIEEAYEVVDAIERGDMPDLVDELGDLLLQVVFHSQMASERGLFEFGDVVAAINAKMIRRHPHVFGDLSGVSPQDVERNWQSIKQAEKAGKPQPTSILADVPVPLPGLTRAVKLQDRAAKVGFDWANARLVLDKIREETDEIAEVLDRAVALPADQADMEEEIGDLLFVIANLARHLHVDPERSVRQANAKFVRRFGHIENQVRHSGRTLDSVSLDEMDDLWNEAKILEKAKPI
ncbi:MAG: nucleoside triphosphate pyrophosphohydrolase [Hyphomicrobiales bacterium]|nr:nucleoside triphosphate pyrophosphohydrolase [Hyphomicrobiales bacterium]